MAVVLCPNLEPASASVEPDRDAHRRRGRHSALLFLLLAPIALAALSCGRETDSGEIRHVVLISVDDLGARHTGAYGYERDTTPTIDGVAAEGTLFENAYVQQTWTLTSHLSLFTGVYPQVHGASKIRPARPTVSTLPEILKRHGFATAGFTGIGGFIGPQFGMGRGFDRYETGENDAAKDNVPRLSWLEDQARLVAGDPDHRFFLFAHYFDVHSDDGTQLPYEVPEPYRLMFSPWGWTGSTVATRRC